MAKVTQAHIDARTSEILEAASRVFARKGQSAATMQDIAGEAGLSAGALYRYFPSKEALIRKVADTAVEVNADLFARAVSGADTPLEALINVGRDVAGWDLEAYAQDFEGMLSGRRDPAHMATRQTVLRRIISDLASQTVRLAQDAGEIDPSFDPELLATALIALVRGFATVALADPEMDRAGVWGVLEEMIRRLAPMPGGAHA